MDQFYFVLDWFFVLWFLLTVLPFQIMRRFKRSPNYQCFQMSSVPFLSPPTLNSHQLPRHLIRAHVRVMLEDSCLKVVLVSVHILFLGKSFHWGKK